MKRAFIETMFRAVDEEQWARLASFYHPACVYDRPGFERLEGLASVLRFYRQERPIRSGVHGIEDVVESERTACAVGTFEGRLRSGADISLRFADHYVFEDGRIAERRTFFYAPLA
jgi:ketosteroid isomerase-like protein